MRDASNITKKGAAVALAAVTAMSLSVPATALADEAGETGSGTTTTTTTTTTKDVTGVLTDTTEGSTTVTTAYTSEYTVTVPESVAMGSDHEATQTASVTVKGKIAAGKQVNVVPASTIEMTSGSETYNLTVTAGDTAWSQSDVTAATKKDNATISAGDAWLPGEFSGSLTYAISLGDETAETTTYTVTGLGDLSGSSFTFTIDPTVDKSSKISELENGVAITANQDVVLYGTNLGKDLRVAFTTESEGEGSALCLCQSDGSFITALSITKNATCENTSLTVADLSTQLYIGEEEDDGGAEAQTFKYTITGEGGTVASVDFAVDTTADKNATIASLGESGLNASYGTMNAIVKADGDYVVIVVPDDATGNPITQEAYTDSALTTRMPSTTTVGDITEIYVSVGK